MNKEQARTNGIAQAIGERFYKFEARLRAVEAKVSEPVIVTDDSEYLQKENEALRAALDDVNKRNAELVSVLESVSDIINDLEFKQSMRDS